MDKTSLLILKNSSCIEMKHGLCINFAYNFEILPSDTRYGQWRFINTANKRFIYVCCLIASHRCNLIRR
jgi:hypothetical protein